MNLNCQRLVLTSGEPAGIGPDLAILLAQKPQLCEIITLACPELLKARAKQLNLPISIQLFSPDQPRQPNQIGELKVLALNTADNVIAGKLNIKNAQYIINMLDIAIDGCQSQLFDGMVTAPLQKSILNDAGMRFSGHTEYLAERTHTKKVVMMLASDKLRVALVTTHLPLREVADAINPSLLEEIITIIDADLKRYFGITSPRIFVSGLNPHAGEGGHLGMEEINIIIPTLEKMRLQGFNLTGPLAADTLFTNKYLEHADIVLAMYHDQGLPVLKYQGFGHAANITLGLPIIRTSVDHGTALDLAGTGKISLGSLETAITTALQMAHAVELNKT